LETEALIKHKATTSTTWLQRPYRPGVWVQDLNSREILFFVGYDDRGNRVYRRRNGEMHLITGFTLEVYDALPNCRGWDDDSFDESSSFPPPLNDEDEDDEDEEEAVWGVKEEMGHRHTLEVVCGTRAEVELDYPAAGGWLIERLS
jgi:hypothetical protein